MKNIYLIKDLARLSGHSIHTVKYYLKIGLLREIGRSPETSFRYFDDSTLSVLQHIRQMRLEGKTLSQISKRLSSDKMK